ncbi:expressed unknown protein [Seminavis robusta]|uniref:Uncharacterized protein n=1 Tax=Seminavis robusta TaxID=568900 RepID=A0A9N8DNG9_9STRA|nr:expressed unknown protein [Seminavis robusta]|eukprot:Sro243_g096900.1 n/a (593) ;mRNA; r:43220-45122
MVMTRIPFLLLVAAALEAVCIQAIGDAVVDGSSLNSQPRRRLLLVEDPANATTTATKGNRTGANFLATYKGRFQIIADGCDGPPPVVQAACGGSHINLISVSDVNNNLACQTSDEADLPDGFASGLTCQTLCVDDDHDDTDDDDDDCAASFANNDGSYTVAEGPWAEVVYECLGVTTKEEVDTLFQFLDTGGGTCFWRLFFDNQLYHLAQLGVMCSYTSTNNEFLQNGFDDLLDGELAISRAESIPFDFDDAYFECSQGDEAAIDFEGPYQDEVLCAVGTNCNGEDCDVSLHTINIHSDVHRFDKEMCITLLNSNATIMEQEENTSSETIAAAPHGSYTMRFQAGWSLLFKNPDFWYDIDDIRCELFGEDTDFIFPAEEIDPLPPIQMSCPNGVIERVETQDGLAVDCEKYREDTLECTYTDGADNWVTLINSFTTVVYECTTNSEYPTTIVTYPNNTITCLDDVYDDLVVGHALQIGLYCRSDDNSQDGDYQFDDFYYECGPEDQYLLLDGNSDSLGDRFTCLSAVSIPTSDLIMTVGGVSMMTEWRNNTTGDSSGGTPNPLCYEFSSEGSAMLANNATDPAISGNATTAP